MDKISRMRMMPMSSLARTSLDTLMSSMRSSSSIGHLRSKGVLLRWFQQRIWVASHRRVVRVRDNHHFEIVFLRCRRVLQLEVAFSFQMSQILMAV